MYTDGVESAKVSFADETARVEYDAEKTEPARFVELIEGQEMGGTEMNYEVEILDEVSTP